GDGSPASLVAAIIAMAKSLDLHLVAEGVDSVHQLDFLRDQGVEIIQGYLFSRPMPIEEFIFLLRDNPFPARLRAVAGQRALPAPSAPECAEVLAPGAACLRAPRPPGGVRRPGARRPPAGSVSARPRSGSGQSAAPSPSPPSPASAPPDRRES